MFYVEIILEPTGTVKDVKINHQADPQAVNVRFYFKNGSCIFYFFLKNPCCIILCPYYYFLLYRPVQNW